MLTGVIVAPAAASREALGPLVLLVLVGGVILYLLALVAVKARAFRRFDAVLMVATMVLALIMAAGEKLPALPVLTMLTGTIVVAVLVELWLTRGIRRRVRQVAIEEQAAMEAEANAWRRRHL